MKSKAKYPWVKVEIEPEMTASMIMSAVEHAMADDGDVPIEAVAEFRSSAIVAGALRSALQFVRVYKAMS